MVMDQAPAQQVCQVSDREKQDILQRHFWKAYDVFVDSRIVPHARSEITGGVYRVLSGIPYPFLNFVAGFPVEEADWDACIDRQIDYFRANRLPFVWFVDEDASPSFEERLKARGFQDAGVLRGVIGALDNPISLSSLPEEYRMEKVQDGDALQDFIGLVCPTFGFEGAPVGMYQTVMRHVQQPILGAQMHHYVIRKNGAVVSALSTLIEGDLVSFWNGATAPAERRHGLSMALRQFALQEAISQGCKFGMSYLMAEGMAFGICSKLGYQTKWRFRAFVAPSS